MRKTNKQLDQWGKYVRKAYRCGKLSKKRIEAYETIPGWFWEIDHKQEAINNLNKILDWSDSRGSLPMRTSKDEQERKYANFISMRKRSKRGKSKNIFYHELDEVAKKSGYPDLFDVRDLKQKTINELNSILDRANGRGHLPKHGSKNKQEAKDSNTISGLKLAKQGKGRRIFYPELEEIAKKHGYHNLFKVRDFKQKAIDQLNKILDRSDKRGRLPRGGGKNEQENKDAQKISQLKQALKGKGGAKFYPELEDIATKRGYSGMFFTLKQRAIKQLNVILDRVDERGNLPKQHSEDEQEAKDAECFNRLKQAKKNKDTRIFYHELEEIAKKRGYPNLFEVRDLKQDAICQLNEILDRADKRGGCPKKHSEDKQEARDARKISNAKTAKQGKGRAKFYPELEKIANKRGYPDLFEVRKRK